ncbi:glycerol-3-phosphate dehydrogenase/oxidase [Verminephrobacter eiseniae]|uniref:glycerol-3-phosphate dehydrogenase/oxidase n=1 Tax=Verminephrobacter eiseniae TaxID=364317 RepID=UPI002237FD03|nr:glycerol-3-phosphate dehydrogenase/oxidase [Verminephrobacter eiseniae]MCW5229832.1 glycerol-3-phosphate dehydrogenase/oxidase [Verminephrobacter eiseniae]MCW5291563.1 glycerol-3-phosphate dehydrogenase/oxidase [Verminephrobacter eiseniae]MCW8186160.1 glycerol-3-phosphate dehydrogenase/oxidase [Verminephrobacter eiseniae]MCW8222894.1 glycerol-3-phosphate dehydrogenase/oxidase [Verminephrobacter eiseniae]MCW8235370.1 glycerol-3-phosphate dehydrogenase/oxidase [Verminephrobacter eiseniae]
MTEPVRPRAPGAEEAADPTWLNPAQRSRDLAAASAAPVDLVVIGAGVTGAGAALDAATRGLAVLLVEAGDIAVGTSSRSGKTFHGGLRYLEQLNFRLVAHAIAERDLMVKTLCPHMARPEAFVYPLTHPWWERPYVGAGVLLYDLFGLKGGAMPRQRHFSRKGLKACIASIDAQRVVGGIQYYDALMDDARHTLAVVRSAAGHGVKVVTRAPVVEFIKDGAQVAGVVLRDTWSGSQHRIGARAVINATGIWADEVQQLAGANSFSVQPAKGVHLLLRPEALQSDSGILARATDSVIIARRWYGYWLVGTTDSLWSGGKAQPVAEAADVDYLLDNLNRYLARKVGRADVLGVYAGLRPLLKPVGDNADSTSALSRDHAVIAGPPGLTTIVGGKYTTYRRMARDAVDAAVRPLGVSRPSGTATLPLVGAGQWAAVRDSGAALAQRLRITPAAAGLLLQRHGDRVRDLLALTEAQPELARALPGAAQYLAAELVYAVQAEGAQTLIDVLVRRTHLSIELADGALALAPFVAELIAPHLGWSAQREQAELHAYERLIQRERAALQALHSQPPTPAAPAAGTPTTR